ncbi:MAG TPA: hypothetical protein VEW28_00265 [Candidatus Kapabacteria bacterium]|nr:hypothetical protein [Candidatus Kapabacteria bacterium]
MSKSHISPSESVAVIEVTGAVALARLLQSLGVETRARIVGATTANAEGAVTVVIAGGLAEVQHANSYVKEFSGVGEIAFFAKPDLGALELLLHSLNITPRTEEENKPAWKQRVRSANELDITTMNEWNVHELRRYARSLSGFPLKGRMISKAGRQELIRLFEEQGIILPKTLAHIYTPAQQLPN